MLKKFAEEKYRDVISILCFVAIGVIFFLLSGSSSFQVTTNFLTNNAFASPNSTLFTPATRVLFNLEYRYVVLFLLALNVLKLIYKLYSTFKTRKSNKKLHNYLDIYTDSLSYSVFIVFLALLAGLEDISTIIFVFIASLIGLSLILFNNNNEDDGIRKNRKIGLILVTLSWLLLIIYSVSTLTYGGVRSTWYVYLLDLLGLKYLFITVIKNKKRFPFKLKKQDREIFQYFSNLFLKLAFFVILAIGLS